MSNDFGVGVALALDAVLLQLPAQRGVILDDAVVSYCDGPIAVARHVRMRIGVGRWTVRGPSSMRDAVTARSRALAQMPNQVADASGPLAQMQCSSGQCRYAGTVVTAVFQPAQSLN